MTVETTTDVGGGSESFTAAEQAYFSSKGTDTAALDAEIAGNGQGTPGAGVDSQAGAKEPQAKTPAGDAPGDDGEDDGEEVVVVGKDGRPRVNGRFVPHQALHKERERRKGVETELQTVRERQARADERLAVLNEILSQADAPAAAPARAAEPEQAIDPTADPLGALNQALKKIQSLEGKITEDQKRAGERESDRAMRTAYQQDAIAYVKEKPEFGQAYKYLIEGRHRELEAMGMADPNQRNQFIANEERGLVAEAIRLKKSPSQMMHSLALARGFTAKAPAQNDDATQKIEQIKAGQKVAGASLSSAGGTSGEGLTAAALADMSEEEFAAVSAKVGKSKIRQLLGG